LKASVSKPQNEHAEPEARLEKEIGKLKMELAESSVSQ
jgi:hypothetical protein